MRRALAPRRYVCPLTRKALSNINPPSVLRPSGRAVSNTAVRDIIRKDMLDPFTEPPTKLKEKDIIALRCEGTGFASRTDHDKLKAKATTSSARL